MPRVTFILLILLITVQLAGCQPVYSSSVVAATCTATKKATPLSKITSTPSPVPVVPPCKDTRGKIEEVNVVSIQVYAPINLKIYLPPCYGFRPGEKYPVLYMLHGQAFMNDQWINLGLTSIADEMINQSLIKPLIIVMPYEEDWRPGPEETPFDEALITGVFKYIESHYTACKTRSCRAVGGLSRGGNWAIYLGFAHPELFTAVGAHSAPLFYGETVRIETSVQTHTQASAFPEFFIDVGKMDSDKEKVLEFVKMIDDVGIRFEFIQYEGRHEELYWSSHVKDYLAFYSSHLDSNK